MTRYIMQAERKDYIDSKLIEYARKDLYNRYFEPERVNKREVVTFDDYVKSAYRDYYALPAWISFEEFVSLFENELKAGYAKHVAGIGSEAEED